MSWANGGMSYSLQYNLPQCKLALNFRDQQIICWAMLCLLDVEGNGRPYVGSWTTNENRCEGYATETIHALLNHIKFSTTEGINVYTMRMYRILSNICYTPVYQEWNENKFQGWLEKNFGPIPVLG